MKKAIIFILIILLVMPIGSTIFRVTNNFIDNFLIKEYGKTTSAVVIDERNYQKNRFLNFGFSYSYLFKIQGKKYKNDTKDFTLKVGDAIEIIYYPSNPNINKPLHP